MTFRRFSLAPFLIVAACLCASTAFADNLTGQASIIDGDTLEIHGARIRLWGIDAPESNQLCRGDDSIQYRCGGRYVQAMTPTCSVLLDLDGTLIDSQPGILASCLAALRALGHEPDETLDIRRAIGPPLEDIMQVLLQPFGDDRVGEAVAAYRQHYGESGLLGSEPYPGIGSSLKEMQQAGLRIYLATSKRETFASRILHHLGFATYFAPVAFTSPSGIPT